MRRPHPDLGCWLDVVGIQGLELFDVLDYPTELGRDFLLFVIPYFQVGQSGDVFDVRSAYFHM